MLDDKIMGNFPLKLYVMRPHSLPFKNTYEPFTHSQNPETPGHSSMHSHRLPGLEKPTSICFQCDPEKMVTKERKARTTASVGWGGQLLLTRPEERFHTTTREQCRKNFQELHLKMSYETGLNCLFQSKAKKKKSYYFPLNSKSIFR